MDFDDKERRNKRDSGYDTWGAPTSRIAIVQMAETGRAKVKELLSRHSELEQSETKAQVALVTVLSLTQITELKLLLDIGRQGHRFYDFVLAMLVACICIEIFIGIIIIYIGNLHYYQASTDGSAGVCGQLISCLMCCGGRSYRRRTGSAAGMVGGGGYGLSHRSAGGEPLMLPGNGSGTTVPLAYPEDEDEMAMVGCCGVPLGGSPLSRLDYGGDVGLEKADTIIEFARIKAADSSVRIARASNYVKVIEDAIRKASSGGSSVELEQELLRAKEDLAAVQRERDEAEAQARLAEAQQHRAFFIKEQREDRQEKITFRRVSYWQHMATYLLYFVMLLNVFITTFGISTGVTNHPMPMTSSHSDVQLRHDTAVATTTSGSGTTTTVAAIAAAVQSIQLFNYTSGSS